MTFNSVFTVAFRFSTRLNALHLNAVLYFILKNCFHVLLYYISSFQFQSFQGKGRWYGQKGPSKQKKFIFSQSYNKLPLFFCVLQWSTKIKEWVRDEGGQQEQLKREIKSQYNLNNG